MDSVTYKKLKIGDIVEARGNSKRYGQKGVVLGAYDPEIPYSNRVLVEFGNGETESLHYKTVQFFGESRKQDLEESPGSKDISYTEMVVNQIKRDASLESLLIRLHPCVVKKITLFCEQFDISVSEFIRWALVQELKRLGR